MEYITYAHLLYGQVYQVGDFGAVALWYPLSPSSVLIARMGPGQNMDDISAVFRSGMWRLFYKLSMEGQKRLFREFFPLLSSTKYLSQFMTPVTNSVRASVLGKREAESWYLVYLGTRPDARGKGYARKLVEHITAQVLFLFRSTLFFTNPRTLSSEVGGDFCFRMRCNRG
jgi:GNAT superfamily N-acetyltransferase